MSVLDSMEVDSGFEAKALKLDSKNALVSRPKARI